MRFYLGTDRAHWLGQLEVPLFVSHRVLDRRSALPVARCDWALDSGGFTELSMRGRWETPPSQYLAAVRRYRDNIGRLEWVSPQDWMCEPWIVAKTGRSVLEHQHRTVDSFMTLRAETPLVIPVLQGFTLHEYLSCAELYLGEGVDLWKEERVGIGSVCRRQSAPEIAAIVSRLADEGLKLHGFGMKTVALKRVGLLMASADSMAWSMTARRDRIRLDGCGHRTCSHCPRWALQWRDQIIPGLEPIQTRLL